MLMPPNEVESGHSVGDGEASQILYRPRRMSSSLSHSHIPSLTPLCTAALLCVER